MKNTFIHEEFKKLGYKEEKMFLYFREITRIECNKGGISDENVIDFMTIQGLKSYIQEILGLENDGQKGTVH